MSKLMKSLPFRLALGVAIGIIAGLIANESFMNLVVTLNYIFGQIISFCVPLIVIGFIAPSITKLGKNASRLLGVALILAYTSSLGAALFSMAAGYTLIPHMSIQSAVDGLRSLPEVVFKLDIPPIMGVMIFRYDWSGSDLDQGGDGNETLRRVPEDRSGDSTEDCHSDSSDLHRIYVLFPGI